MFDTHCHLNFKAFHGKVNQIIGDAKQVGVTHIVVPGTDIETSEKAVKIANQFDNVYAAVGIHPHHVFELKVKSEKLEVEIQEIEQLLKNKKVVAVGEVGIDRHYYVSTKHENYSVDEIFIKQQKEYLKAQIQLAFTYKKSLVLHNREAKQDMLSILSDSVIAKDLTGKTVFHCCEPDDELLEFAKKHGIFIGVDGDVTHRKDKQAFIKKVPLEMLVLETDSPFLHPEPLRSQPRNIRGPNEPKNLKTIAEFVAHTTNVSINQLIDTTTENAKKLFQIN